MIPQLSPEILLLIAQHVKRPVPLTSTASPSIDRAINDDKWTLVKMMKASQTMYNICSPVLYQDVVTDDFPSFASGLRKNENIDNTARLHINHERHDHLRYQEIIDSNGWIAIGTWRHPQESSSTVDLASVARELAALVKQGTRIRQFITEGLTILPRLQIVSMGGIYGDVFNTARAPVLEDRFDQDFETKNKTLPHALLDLPTVKHFCQAVRFGPLSLPNSFIESHSAIDTYTLHNRGTPVFCACVECPDNHSPPIVLGATNRYYCGGAYFFPSTIDPENNRGALMWLNLIITMLTRQQVMIADPETGTAVPLDERVSPEIYNRTTIELYDYIRVVDIGFITIFANQTAKSNWTSKLASMPPHSLAFFQENLHKALPEIWKGRVKLLNREDAPNCRACGFNPQESFINEGVSTDDYMTPDCLYGLWA